MHRQINKIYIDITTVIAVHFDVMMTMIVDTLYTMLARKLRGFEYCDPPRRVCRQILLGDLSIQHV
jgi:hypothetical protein